MKTCYLRAHYQRMCSSPCAHVYSMWGSQTSTYTHPMPETEFCSLQMILVVELASRGDLRKNLLEIRTE